MPLRFSPARGATVLLSSSSRGPAGSAATIAVGTTTTGAAGSAATVANAGSSSAATFNFTIPRGADAGLKYTFDTSTDTSTTPSSGGVKFNHATPASITEIAIHATDADGNTARPTILTYDDSSSTAKGKIAFKRYDGITIVLNVDGSFTDNTTWLKLTVTHSAGTTLFSASDKIYLTERITGDAGTGNVNASSTFGNDNRIIRSDGSSRDVQASTAVMSDAGVISAGMSFANAALAVQDTDASHNLFIVPGSDLTADRNLTLTTGDAGRTVTISGNATISQDYSTTGSPTFANPVVTSITTANTGLHILDTNASHDLIIAPGSDLTADRTLTVTTGDADRTLTISGNATISQDYSSSGSPTFASPSVTTLELGSGGATDATLARSAAGIVTVEGTALLKAGKQTIFIPAGTMKTRTTNGAAVGSVEQTTNKNMVTSLDFDTTTQEFAQFSVWFPKSWDLGTVTFQPAFSQLTTAAGGVVFGLAGVAVSDGDALDVAYGTAQTSTKTAGTANLEYQGPESSAITIAGTPAAGDRVMFQVNRTVADGSDTLAQDARLHGIRLFFTTNAATDV